MKIEPRRPAQVPRVSLQPMAVQVRRKDALARRGRFLLAHRVEAGPAPGGLRALDNERRRVGVELVGMRPDPAVLRLLEDEGEGVLKPLLRTEPDVFAGPYIDIRLEHVSQGAANPRIRAV